MNIKNDITKDIIQFLDAKLNNNKTSSSSGNTYNSSINSNKQRTPKTFNLKEGETPKGNRNNEEMEKTNGQTILSKNIRKI